MVWAMKHANGFGEYFLDGDFVGRKQNLGAHFDEVLDQEYKDKFSLECGPDYVYHVSQKFLQPREGEGPPAIALPALQEHELPKNFAIETTRKKSFGSLIKLVNRMIAVDDKLKEIVETVEPHVHEFWPIEIFMPSGEAYPKSYYGLRIGNHLDSFLPGQSETSSWTTNGITFQISNFSKKNCSGIVMSSALSAGKHLWREVRLKSPDVYFSDELASAIAEAKLNTPKLLRLGSC